MEEAAREDGARTGMKFDIGRVTKAGLLVLIASAMALSTVAISQDTSLLRIGLAVLLIVAFATVSLRNPGAAAVLALCLAPFLALIRRVLIPYAGWTSWDALLVVVPIVSVILAYRLFVVGRRPIATDLLSKLVGIFLLITLVESVNPASGGLAAGLTGLLFSAAPLAWFFIGRELAGRRFASTLLPAAAFVAMLIAIYGLAQTTIGLTSWDSTWQNISGYTALSVQGSIRAFGTFSSAAEYATYLALGLVVAFVAVLYGRVIALAAIPLLAYALFLESSRTIIVLVLVAAAVTLGLRTGRASLTVVCLTLAVAAGVATISFLGPTLTESALNSGSPFIAHQAGLFNPFDPKLSTLPIHQGQVINGLQLSLLHPLGLGLAPINPQAARLAPGSAVSTELDFSNAFLALGPAGGLIYLAILALAFYRAIQVALTQRHFLAQATVAVMITVLGQWLNGGYYAVAPLVWFIVGSSNGEYLQDRAVKAVKAQGREPSRLFWSPWPAWQ